MMRIDPKRWAFRQPIYGGNLTDDATIEYYHSTPLPGLQATRYSKNVMRKKLQRYWDKYRTKKCGFKPSILNNEPTKFDLYLVASIDGNPHAYAECDVHGKVVEVGYLCGSDIYASVAEEIMQVLHKYAISNNKIIKLTSATEKSNEFYESIGMTKDPEPNRGDYVMVMDSYRFEPGPGDQPMVKTPRTYRTVHLS